MRRAALAVLLGSATAAAEPVAVKVVDVAGGAVYVAPGRAAGIAPGTVIRVRGAELIVVEATEKTAMVRLDAARIAVGDAGTADVSRGAAAAAGKRLDRPRPAEAFTGQWSEAVPPASQQAPRSVPLGQTRRASGARATVIGHAFATTGGGGSTGDAELRVIAAYDVVPERGLVADLDVAARWFGDGFNGQTRTPLFVRAAELRYGAPGSPRVTAGRMPLAAAWIGMLDGARASARVGALEVAAFGGAVPDPQSGKPDGGAARFGGELGYDAPDAAWQPRLSVAVHGSTWQGALDERRLSIAASAARGGLWLDGWAEAQGFAEGNPWGASAVELTGAGASAAWQQRGLHVGIDATFLRPERSLRLAAALPPEWLCTLAPGASTACVGGDWWGAASVSAGTRTPRWSLDAVATLSDSQRQYRGLDRSGYLRGELRADPLPLRVIGGVAGGTTSFASWTAGELGAGFAPSRALDLALTYRPEALDYAASTELQIVHSVIADARFALSAALDVALSAIAATGGDRDALAVLATLVWRPLP